MPEWIAAQLAAWRDKELTREVVAVEQGAQPWVTVGGRRYLNFGSSNYLGLSQHPKVIAALVDGARRWGVGTTASPLMTGYAPIQAALDEAIARYVGKAAAVSFVSGYAANVGTLAALAGPGDALFLDALAHASLIDGARLSHATVKFYRHGDAEDLARRLAHTPVRRRRLVVTDGVFSMDGDVAPLGELIAVARQFDALLMVDDAHGLGVLGERGAGLAELLGVTDQIPVVIGTYSKGLGVQGGFVACDADIHAWLVQRARSWIYSAAMAPALARAALTALQLAEEGPARRAHLHQLSQTVRQTLGQWGYRVVPTSQPEVPIIAVVVGEAGAAVALAEALRQRGLWVNAVRPPTVPAGTSRLRISLTASHTAHDIAWALEQWAAVGRPMGTSEGGETEV
jgi:8-amino-7-oxononanoate synthase